MIKITKINILNKLLLITLAISLSSCSVYRAIDGVEAPKSEKIIGSSRMEIEQYFGSPISITQEGSLYRAIYVKKIDEPDYIRAGLHAAMDAITFALWELYASGAEKDELIFEYEYTVFYDSNMIAKDFSYKVLGTL